ncbi:MAG: NAD kinase [Proteiniphilum sp.]|nr:NAD kinase [Proteiniphilum sp.]
MKVALFGSSFNKQAPKAESQIITVCMFLHSRASQVFLNQSLYQSLSKQGQLMLKELCTPFTDLPDADIALSIGGDGTFLRTANTVGRSGMPVLGINTGRLGFLADINFHDLDETLDEIFNGEYIIEERQLLEVSNNKSGAESQYALNEVALLKQDTSSMLTIHTYIDNDYLTSYQADGLIVATPTGSTAYALSVGGPILMPKSSSLVLAPIAPHNLTSRPLVVNDDVKIRIKTESRSNTFLVSTDGNSNIFKTSTEISISRADYTLKVIKRVGHSFYDTLRDKLLWGVDVRK